MDLCRGLGMSPGAGAVAQEQSDEILAAPASLAARAEFRQPQGRLVQGMQIPAERFARPGRWFLTLVIRY